MYTRNNRSAAMNSCYNIIKCWKLSVFASFMGSIILISCLKDTIHFLEPSNFTVSDQKPESEKLTDQREEKCNIFDGNWVYDPKASPHYRGYQCPFLREQVSCSENGRQDIDYEKWIWKAKDCEIPMFNGTDMLERLRGKRMIIVGDSLNRNQWESLVCLLYSAIPPSQQIVVTRNGRHNYNVFRAQDYGCSVEFYKSPFLVQLDVNKANGNRVLRLNNISFSAWKWRGADIMVFNTGHWWVARGQFKKWDLFQYKGNLIKAMKIEHAVKRGMRTWARWIDHNVDMTKTTVFFRSYSPDHLGNQWCYEEKKPITDESLLPTFPRPLTEIVERTIQGMRTPIKYLNITKLTQYRRDAHPSVYASKEGKTLIRKQQKKRQQPRPHVDCTHWCLPGLPDTWNTLLYASMVI